MNLLGRLRQLFGRRSGKSERADDDPNEYLNKLTGLAERLDESRGDRVVAGPAESSASSSENVGAAAKDYGLSLFSGESDALAEAADSYRSSKTPNKRRE